MADDLTFTPIAQPPDKGLKFTKFASDGGAAVRSIFPGAVVTSGHRTNNIGSPGDDHHFSNGAVDVAPIKGMTFEQFTGKLKSAGYPIIQALDEVKHPSKGATGPHWHVALGEHESGLSFTTQPKPAGAPQKGLTFTPHPSSQQPPQSAPRPVNGPPAQEKELGLGESLLQGVKNIPSSAVKTAKGIGHAIVHPVETAEGIGEFAGGALTAGMDKLGVPGTTPRGKRAEASFRQTVDPWLEHPYKQLKKSFAEDPVGTSLTFVPAAGAAGKLSKLGIKGVDAARLASLSPEARAALRAKRVEDAAVSKRYKDMARPIMARHRTDAERASAELRVHQKTVGNLSAEEQRKLAIAADTGDRTGIAPEHHGALDAVRKMATDYKAKIEKIYREGGMSVPEFVENYYKHWWDPKTPKGEIEDFLKRRQGSASSLKHRTIPTLAEGIAAGLKPRHENMLDTMTHYAHQVSGHLVNHDLMNAMRKDPGIGAKWVSERSVPDGMRRLEGMGTTRAGRGISKEIEGQNIHTGNAPPMVLAAKDAAARLYNRRISKGLAETLGENRPALGKAVKGVETASRALTSTKLFSAFHPTLIAGKAVGSEIGNGIRHLTRLAPKDVAKSLAHMPFAPVTTAMQGMRMGKRILKGEEAATHIDKLYQEAGGSLRSGTPYHTVDSPSYLESTLRGTLKTDLKRALANIKDQPVRGPLKMVGRALDSMNDAVFRFYVPAIKRGAFERELMTSLKAHPEWGEAEQASEARRVFSSIEGRMGEMTRDNMFWTNMEHDIARLIFLSPSWQIGNARILEQAAKEIPESMRDVLKGRGISQGPAQAMGLLGSFMVGNGVLQYLYTGQKPSGMHDLLAARTGGTNTKDGSPERVMMPGVVKELYEYMSTPLDELTNVLNPGVKTAHELFTNRDWRQDPIFHPSDADWQPNDPSYAREGADYAATTLTPIPFGDNPNGDNSKVGALSAFAGMRPAGTRWANPERYARTQKYFANQAMAKRRRDQAKDKAAKRKRQ